MISTRHADNIHTAFRTYIPAALIGLGLFIVSLFWFNVCGSRTFLAFALLATAAGVALAVLYCDGTLSQANRSEHILAGVLLFFAVVYTFAFPPLTVPDEAHHFYSSYWLADSLIGHAGENGFEVRTNDWKLFTERGDDYIDADSYKRIAANFELFQSDESTVTVDYFEYDLGAENLPAKIATVVSILVGRFLHLGTYPLFYLGRLFNAISYIALAITSYRMIPFGKNVIAAASLLPMTLHLVSSFSYDVGIIGLGMLLTSLLLKAITEDGQISSALQTSIILVSALLAPCKVVYSTLILLALFIPSRRFSSSKHDVLFKLGAIIAPLLAVFALRLAAIGGLAASGSTLDVRGSETGHFYDLAFVLHNPLATISIFFRSLINNGDFYWSTALGRSLGWLQSDIAVPYFYVIPLLFGTVYAAQRDDSDPFKVPGKLRLAMLLVAALSFLGIMFSMFVGHTFDTEPVIQGVQGRYILPVIAPLLLSLRSKTVRIEGRSFPQIILVMSISNIVILMHVVASAIML